MATYEIEGEKKRKHIGAYEIGRTLGEGAFGKVKLGTNIFTGEKARRTSFVIFHHRLARPLGQYAATSTDGLKICDMRYVKFTRDYSRWP